MSQVNPIQNGAQLTRFERAGQLAAATRPEAPLANGVRRASADSVDLSAAVRQLDAGPVDGSIRTALVDRIRQEIEAGEYETPERLDRALDSLSQSIGDS